jgi:hypothetical protein
MATTYTRTTQTQNKRTQTSMSRVVFEPTIPVLERAKTVHALDRAVNVLGSVSNLWSGMKTILWHVDPLLGTDLETNETTAVAMLRS